MELRIIAAITTPRSALSLSDACLRAKPSFRIAASTTSRSSRSAADALLEGVAILSDRFQHHCTILLECVRRILESVAILCK